MGGYTPAPKPECTQQYWPTLGGLEAAGIEGEGAPGNKMENQTPDTQGWPENGAYNTAAQAANAAAHQRPAVSADPTVTQVPAVGPHGGIDGPDPYGLTEYPHAGPPPRTWNTASSATVNEGEGS